MKCNNMKKLFGITAFMIAAVILLSGCAGKVTDTDTAETDTETETTDTETEKPKSESYMIIYPADCEGFVKELANDIKTDINGKAEKKVNLRGDTTDKGEYEILIGNTNREESSLGVGGAGNDGWWVLKSGNTIVINGASRKGLASAVEHFLENYTVSGWRVDIAEQYCKTQYERSTAYTGLTLRVGSYNIKHGEEASADMSEIAADINSKKLDIVGLQEVDVGTNRVGGRNTLKILAEKAGYEYYYFCKAIDYQGGEYGTAIMSKYPIKSFEVIPLYGEDGIERRAMGHAVIDVNGTEIDYINTHLSYEKTSLIEKQFKQINELVKDKDMFIVTADFNTEYNVFYRNIENSVRVNHGKHVTFPSGASSIDDIVVDMGWGVNESGRVSGHSDHDMLWAELCYNGGNKD